MINNILQEPKINKAKEVRKVEIMSQSLKIAKFISVMVLLLFIGFSCGQYYEAKNRSIVYVLNEAKFLKLVSVALAIADKDKPSEHLVDGDTEDLKMVMKNLRTFLDRYSRHPVLIQKKNNQGYELYSTVRKIDITKDLSIELIGKERWEEIGKALTQ